MSQVWHTWLAVLAVHDFSYLKVFILPALHVRAGEVSSEKILTLIIYWLDKLVGVRHRPGPEWGT
jgi:hypothetical protein